MLWMIILTSSGLALLIGLIIMFLFHHKKIMISQVHHHQDLSQQIVLLQERQQHLQHLHDAFHRFLNEQKQWQHDQREKFDQHQFNLLKVLQDTIHQGLQQAQNQMRESSNQQNTIVQENIARLTQSVAQQMKDLCSEVDRRLNAGFEKTTATFTDVMKRLTIIDQAQQKITELSGNVVSLQEILADKRSRGAFGEVQLSHLISNMVPEQHFKLQYTLSNGKRVDCMLLLPEPTGNIAIDAKFPLENFNILSNPDVSVSDRRSAEQQFRQDIRHHIQDIAEKYIIAGETSDGAVMFVPAESVFAEIHAHYPDIVEYAHRQRVWLVSPNTMMAVLTTVRAVIKDAATRKQVHIIQEHLIALNKDFARFQKRMDDLSKHISQAHQDMELVHTSSQKISHRFQKIEQVELSELIPKNIEIEKNIFVDNE